MDIKEIKKELLAAVTLIEDYEQYGMSIDRDAAIDKIRLAYQALRFDDGCRLPVAPVASEEAEAETEQTDAELNMPDVEVEFIMPEFEGDEPEMDEIDVQVEESEEFVEESEEETEDMVEEPKSEIETEIIVVSEPAEESKPEPDEPLESEVAVEQEFGPAPKLVEPKPIVVPKFEEQPIEQSKVKEPEVEAPKNERPTENESVEGNSVVEQSLFGDSEQWSHPKPRSRRRLVSLYDDDIVVAAQPEVTQSQSKPLVSEPEQLSVPKSEVVADTVAEVAAPKILGEAVESIPTIGDTMVATPSVGESTVVESLRKAITVGNRIMLVRDLFDGDEALYERTISLLDEMNSLDDCIIYIAENFVWRPSSEGAKLVIDLLQRKFR